MVLVLNIVLFLFLFLCTIPLFVRRNKTKTRLSDLFTKIIVALFFSVSLHYVLMQVENILHQTRLAQCPPELVYQSTTFGSTCVEEISNSFARILDTCYGGPFDGMMTMTVGLLIVFALSIVGFVAEIKSTKKYRQPISQALWSVSFFTLVLFLALIMLFLLRIYVIQ